MRYLSLREIYLPKILQLIGAKFRSNQKQGIYSLRFPLLCFTVQKAIKSPILLKHEAEGREKKMHLIARILHFYQHLYE